MLGGEPVDEVDFGAHGDGATGWRVLDLLDDVGGRTGAVGGVDHVHRAFGVHNDLDTGVGLAGAFDLLNGEALVYGAEALPQDHLRVRVLFGRGPAVRLERVPQGHLVEAHTHGERGVAAQVLVGEEQHALAAFERPFKHGARVGARAHDAAVASAEGFERGRGVHIGDRDDLLLAISVRSASADIGQLLPAVGHLVDIGHVGH